MKILDPHGYRHISKAKIMEFLELVARGTVTDQQTLVSRDFAKNLLKLFELEGCLSDNGSEVLMEKVEEAFKHEVFNIELLNQVLKIECIFEIKSKNHHID